MKVRIVLVEPHEAGNVGAASRAMKNFGIHDLVIVGSRQLRTDTVSQWWAAGAEDLVANARRVETLAEALEDCELSVATTAVRGRQIYDQLTPEGVARLAEERLGDEHTLAIVFGREEWGLSGAEMSLCQRTAVIETDPAFPTMNLAQSIAVFCYELGKGLRPKRADAEPAPERLMQVLHRTTRQLLDEIDFFHARNGDHMCAELQALAGRAGLSMREASLLLSAVRLIRKNLGTEKPQTEG